MQLGFVENGDVDAEIIQTFDVGGVNFRREVVGRFVAEVAGIADGVGQSAVGGKFLIVDLRFAQKFDFFQFGVAVSRLFGEIFVKTVAAEFYSEGYAGRGFAGGKRVLFVGGNENGGGFFAADFLIEFAAENLQVERVWPGARAGGDDRLPSLSRTTSCSIFRLTTTAVGAGSFICWRAVTVTGGW